MALELTHIEVNALIAMVEDYDPAELEPQEISAYQKLVKIRQFQQSIDFKNRIETPRIYPMSRGCWKGVHEHCDRKDSCECSCHKEPVGELE